jgi:adenylate cyclase
MAQDNLSQSTIARRKTLIIILIAVVLIILEIWTQFPDRTTPLERLELSAGDTAIRLRGEQPPNEDIVIVDIDDESLAWVDERWPWSRSRLAEIITWLNTAGAKAIAFDITLFDPSPNSADDQALAEAFRGANAVFTVSQVFKTSSAVTQERPLEVFRRVVNGYGITEIERDDDAIVRGVNAFEIVDDEVVYHWAFEIAAFYLGTTRPTQPSLASLQFNGKTVPLNQRSRLLVNYAGPPQTYPTYSVAFVPLGDYASEIFRDKIVLIGTSSETLQDLYPTPFSATRLTPGVEIVANAVATLISGEYFRLTPPWTTILIIIGLALLARLLSGIPRPTIAILSMAAGILGYFLLRQFIFIRTGWQFAIVSPSLMLLLGVVAPSLDQAILQELEKRRIRSLFSRFISPQMVDQLLKTQDLDSLNKRTELSIMFSDIRGFTSLSEKMSPYDLVNLLNPYLQAMTEIIHKYGGTVDKYEGDAIIAFFGEPLPFGDHALRAAMAAIEMRQALQKLNLAWQAQGLFDGKLEMGIGINTGEVFVGLIGSEQRVNYTIIGDTANLAARLQDQTKELGHPILISGTTYTRIKDKLQAEYIDTRILKGKSEPVEIFRLIVTPQDSR